MMENINFEKIKEKIIPYFVKVYGEEYKDIIIERMNNIVPIFYSTLNEQEQKMNNELNKKRVELTLKFLEHNNIQISDELKNKIITNYSTYFLTEIEEANNLLDACFGKKEYTNIVYSGLNSIIEEKTDTEYKKKQSIETLNKLGINVEIDNYDEWITTKEAHEIFEYINNLKEYIKELDSEYNEFAIQFDELKQLIDKGEKFKNDLNEKYMIQFLENIKDHLSPEDNKKLEEYINSDQKNWYRFTSDMSTTLH